jgi:hypothetical protein
MKYSQAIVSAFCKSEGLPAPIFEVQFHPGRKWRWDLCWPDQRLALEVQGGIFVQGRHSRGAAMLKEWEKLNTAASNGWRVLFVQPRDLCLVETMNLIRNALRFSAVLT